LNNTYISEKTNIVDALNEVDAFTTRIKTFIEEHPEYSYTISLDKEDKLWLIKLNISNEKNN